MRKDWELNQDGFDRLLCWLGPDREQSAIKYEEIRNRIIKIMITRGSLHAEEIADESINRVIRKLPEIISTYTGDPALFFYGVAQNVYKEFRHRMEITELPSAIKIDPPDDKEMRFKCLEKCLQELSPENRQLLLEYYRNDRREKILHRSSLAEDLKISKNALRLQVYRLRAPLYKCINECLEKINS